MIGIGPSELRINASEATLVYSSFEENEFDYTSVSFVVAGTCQVEMPPATHPDFIVIRAPEPGELFDSDTYLLWLTPDRVVEIRGEFAIEVLSDRHGSVVSDLDALLSDVAFDRALELLTDEFGYEVEGESGRRLIDGLTHEIDQCPLRDRPTTVIAEIARNVDATLKIADY